MKPLLSIVALALSACASSAAAVQLQPFVATYQVFNAGRELGDATLQVVRSGSAGDDTGSGRWRVDLGMKGRGLMRLTGLNVQQSTLFDSNGAGFRPLSQATVKRAFLASRKSVGVYDWTSRTARWSGDVKTTRTGPIALRDGDMSGLLIDLAVIRDAAPGKTLRYRFVDDGRVRDHTWVVAAQTETIRVGDLSFDAMRVERLQDGGDQTTLWVADGVPTPIRILQREDGQDTTDLRLVQYSGIAQRGVAP